MSYIYIMKAQFKDGSGSFYKIGRTRKPAQRLKQIAQHPHILVWGIAFDLFYVLLINADSPVGDETFWHQEFYHKRIGGYKTEWFTLELEDIQQMYKYYGWLHSKDYDEKMKLFPF